MNAVTLTRIVVFVLLAILAFLLSRRIAAPRQRWLWVTWLVILVIAPYIGVSAKLIDVPGFSIHFNDALQGFIFGLLAGWLLNK
jgi:hypothetical protein